VCGQLQLSAERLSVRYFALDAERAENGTLRYEFEYDAHVYYNQIYGAIRRTSRRRYNGLPSRLHSFDLSEEEYERARQLVSGSAGPPPIAIEFLRSLEMMVPQMPGQSKGSWRCTRRQPARCAKHRPSVSALKATL